MKKVEILIVIIIVIAVILQSCSIEGGLLLNTLSSVILMLFYLLFGVLLLNNIQLRHAFKKEAYREARWQRLFLAFISSISFVIMLAGILFAISRWEGAALLLKAGLTWLLPVFAISLAKYISKPSKYYAGILLRSGGFFAIGIMLLICRL